MATPDLTFGLFIPLPPFLPLLELVRWPIRFFYDLRLRYHVIHAVSCRFSFYRNYPRLCDERDKRGYYFNAIVGLSSFFYNFYQVRYLITIPEQIEYLPAHEFIHLIQPSPIKVWRCFSGRRIGDPICFIAICFPIRILP